MAEGSIIILDNEGYTNDNTPSLQLFAVGADEMQFALSSDGFIGNWTPYATGFGDFDISGGGDGGKTVWVQYRDLAGNLSIPTADQTIYDTAAPTRAHFLLIMSIALIAVKQANFGSIYLPL